MRRPWLLGLRSSAAVALVLVLDGYSVGGNSAASATSRAVITASGTTSLVSVSTPGVQGNRASWGASVSHDGTKVSFTSSATNLVEDSRAATNVYVRDVGSQVTSLVSVGYNGAPADGPSRLSAISADGRYVAFFSTAANLVAEPTDMLGGIFVRDLVRGRTTLASVALDGTPTTASSTDRPSISGHGRFVAFSSGASDLVAHDRNGDVDVFVRNLLTGHTRRASVDSQGRPVRKSSFQPAISSDGRYVAFSSSASALAPRGGSPVNNIYVRDLRSKTTERVSVNDRGGQSDGYCFNPSISAHGRFVAFDTAGRSLSPSDTNNVSDVYVHDRLLAKTRRVSVGANRRQGDGGSGDPAIAAHGQYVAFATPSGNLLPGGGLGLQVLVRSRVDRTTKQVSVSTSGVSSRNNSFSPSISADGGAVAFESIATNLVANDMNGSISDVFVHTG